MLHEWLVALLRHGKNFSKSTSKRSSFPSPAAVCQVHLPPDFNALGNSFWASISLVKPSRATWTFGSWLWFTKPVKTCSHYLNLWTSASSASNAAWTSRIFLSPCLVLLGTGTLFNQCPSWAHSLCSCLKRSNSNTNRLQLAHSLSITKLGVSFSGNNSCPFTVAHTRASLPWFEIMAQLIFLEPK